MYQRPNSLLDYINQSMLIYPKKTNNQPLDINNIQASSTVVLILPGMNQPKIVNLEEFKTKSQK